MSPSDIIRPTPDNSNTQIIEPPAPTAEVVQQPIVESTPIEEETYRIAPSMPEDALVDDTANESGSVEPEAVSLDHLRMSQQINSWDERPNTMRHITDHFSRDGEPFARRGVVGRANYFGVDRHQCCDEWDGFGKCGGLKANPGHWGIPGLRSKENCDTATRLLKSCRANKVGRSSCGCSQCCP